MNTHIPLDDLQGRTVARIERCTLSPEHDALFDYAVFPGVRVFFTDGSWHDFALLDSDFPTESHAAQHGPKGPCQL